MSRFYLTLPSNSSMDYCPQNTVAKYTTKLNTSIELDGDWEVGLTEISFPYNIEDVARRECFFKISTNSALKLYYLANTIVNSKPSPKHCMLLRRIDYLHCQESMTYL